MMDKLLAVLEARHPLRALEVGDFATLKAGGMTFTVKAYEAEGLGHVSVMQAKGFLGLMKMDTLMINPTAVDLPLYSYDRIYAMGNDTLIVELYDTLLSPFPAENTEAAKAAAAHLPERDPGTHWYDGIKLSSSLSKKGKKTHTPALDDLALRHLEAYLTSPVNAVTATDDKERKQAKAAAYVEGLLAKGGPSTDVFKKQLGEDVTATLFRTVLFGTSPASC